MASQALRACFFREKNAEYTEYIEEASFLCIENDLECFLEGANYGEV